jgi:plasmid maintenance system antidote protein VapI
MASLAGVLRGVMEDSGLSIYRIAKDSGVDYSVVNRFYHGERDVTLSTAEKLVEYFDLELRCKQRKTRSERRI